MNENQGEDAVTVGYSVKNGAPYQIPLSTLHSTGTHIIAAAGYGKSFLLRKISRDLARLRQPFALLDSHGDAAEAALWYLRLTGTRPENVVHVNPSCATHSIGFNPLSSGLGNPGEVAGYVLDSISKAFGNASFDAAPRMEAMLRAVIRTLIDSRLTMLEGMDVLAVDNVLLRRALRENVTDELVRQDLIEYDKLSRSERLHVGESAKNRLRRIIQAVPVQMMLAQTERTLDLRRIMDEGKYLIVNLSGVPPEIQRLLGALILNGIHHAAKQRNPRRRRNWTVIADEFGEYATRDIANSLDGLRKFGVTVIAAHQRLDQLSREDPDVLSAVATNMKIKVVMGGLSRADAEFMARELFTGAVNGERVKHELRSTKYRPVASTFEVESEAESGSDSWSTSDSSSQGYSEGESSGLTDSHVEHPEDPWYDHSIHPFGRSVSSGRQMNHSQGHSEGKSAGESRGWSRSRSVVPITLHEKYSETSSIAYHSVAEEWERHIALVHGLGKREALIRAFNGPVMHIRTADMPPEILDDRWHRFKRLVMERSPYAQPVEAVQRQIDDRRRALRALCTVTEEEGRPFDIGSFRQ